MKRRASEGEGRESRQNESALAACSHKGGSSCLSICKAQLSRCMINFSSLLDSARSLEMFRFGAPKELRSDWPLPGLIC